VQAVAVMSNAQSQMSVDTAESHCQVTPSVSDGTMQTEHHVMQTEAQTELSIAWRAERESQAVVPVSESAVQAFVSVDVINCQTDSSMANLLSCDVQASVDVTCSESQTDLVQSDSEAQTEVCFHSLQHYCIRLIFSYVHVLCSFCKLCPVLETKDKPWISYSEIRGYSEVYPRVKFWHFSNIFFLGATILRITRQCL